MGVDIMNLIHSLCISIEKLNRLPKWKIISRKKEIKNFNSLKDEFFKLNVFDLADYIISYIVSLPEEIMNDIKYCNYNKAHMCIYLTCSSDNKAYNIDYCPTTHRFQISNLETSYSIYKDYKPIMKHVRDMWDSIEDDFKNKCFDMIIRTAELL